MQCKEHPNYGGKRTPRSDCKGCWEVYNHNKGIKKDDVKAVSKESAKADGARSVEEGNQKPAKPVSPRKKFKKTVPKEGLAGADRDGASVKEVKKPEPEVKPEPKVVLPKDLAPEVKKAVEELIDSLVEETLAARLTQLRGKVAKEVDLQWEHIWVCDSVWHPKMMTKLQEEGWQWMHHSWPLVEKGVISGKHEYTTLKRVKRDGNKPVPDFTNEKIVKRYGGTINKKK